MNVGVIHRHFFGGCTICLGAWELAAFATRRPTITYVCRKHRKFRVLWLTWLVALGYHLWEEES